jgi:hypothetical protein
MKCICYKELEYNNKNISECSPCGQRLMVFGSPHILYTPSCYVVYQNKMKVKIDKPYMKQVYDSLLLDGMEPHIKNYIGWLHSIEGKEVKKRYIAFMLNEKK